MPAQSLTQIDPILVPFLEAGDEAECDRLLDHLTSEIAEPVIRRVIRNKLGSAYCPGSDSLQSDAEDVYNNAVLSLVSRLREIKRSSPDGVPIGSLANYAAVVAFNAWNEHLRSKYPLRNQLKNKLRYLFTHTRGFALWQGPEGEQLCGLREWQREGKAATTSAEAGSLRDDSGALERAGLLNAAERADIQKVAPAVLKLLARPLEFDDLVGIIAEVAGVKDVPSGSVPDERRDTRPETIRQPGGGFDKAVECRLYLEALWEEIGGLPPRQRIALLLNLKDPEGENGLELFSHTGVAGVAKIARAVEMSTEELAGLWNKLPFEDSVIADRLGITRQQVINLRKSARQRLARRMKEN